MTQNDQTDEKSFEVALEELRQIVTRLEQGDGKLDEALAAYEKGAALKAICEKRLAEAKERIELISVGPQGPQTTPFDA